MSTATPPAALEDMVGSEQHEDSGETRQERIARELRENTVAIRFTETRLGTTKSMTSEQKERVANTFGADSDYVRGSRRIVNVKHERYRAVTRILSQASAIWKHATFPFPEHLLGPQDGGGKGKGVRLVSRDRLAELEGELTTKREELHEAVQALQGVWSTELLPEAREKLSELGVDIDYPGNVTANFGFRWDFVEVESPDYLQRMHPEIYRREQARVQQQFQQALTMHEQALARHLDGLVQDMVARLQPGEDGEAKKFTNRSIAGFNRFFEEFREMNLGSSEQLDAAVDRAQRALSGVNPESLNESAEVRQSIQDSMEQLSSAMDGFITNRPRRRIRAEEEDTGTAEEQGGGQQGSAEEQAEPEA